MRFNNLSHDEKLEVKKLLEKAIEDLGGQFNFFKMLEDIREAKKHPLTNKTGKMHFSSGTISWDKHIYDDKIEVLKQIAISSKEENILNLENEKLKKQATNTVKTMANLSFTLKNKNIKDGEGFTFKPFNIINDSNVEFDTLFQIIFIDSINNTKKISKYK